MARSNEQPKLHPALRRLLPSLESRIAAAGLPLRLFEARRSPFRQAELFASGTKTKAKAWQSYHQYGVAVDYVFIDAHGIWGWKEPRRGMWKQWTQIVTDVGLRSISWEEPHAELPWSLKDLEAGNIQPGDASWQAALASDAELWGTHARVIGGITHPGAPRWALDLGDRPDIVAQAV